MANCSSNCGCGSGCSSCGSSSCNGYGALNSLRQSCSQFPFYTGPCPAAPCTGCGCVSGNNCDTGCNNGCSCGCNNACGCAAAGGVCGRCGAALNRSGVCGSCGWCGNTGCSDGCGVCGSCGAALNRSDICGSCGWHRAACGCHTGWKNTCSCGCHHDCCAGQYGGWNRPHYAVFTLGGPLSLGPGSTVGLIPRDCNTDLFDIDNGNIIIRAPGFYYVAVTVDIPQGTAVDTTMRLALDNRPMLPPRIAVTTGDDGTTSNFAGHTVFWAGPGSVLSLETQDAMDIAGATAQPVFTLTMFRL